MSDLIERQAAQEKIESLINEMETIFSDIREKLVDDSVCGLCEYDCDHGIDGCANECPGFERDDCFKLKEEYRDKWMDLSGIPSVTPKQRTGHWIKRLRHQNAVKRYTGKDVITGEIHTIQILERYGYTEYYCSECGSICGDVSMNYCCVCGTKMVEPQEREAQA